MTTLQKAQARVRSAHHIVAFTGAGISTDSGIPDLAGIDQILAADPQFHGGVFRLLDPAWASAHPDDFYRLYRLTFYHPDSQPNPAHQALVTLAARGQLSAVVTMNIDYLHQQAGSPTVIEYWGDMRLNHCVDCGQVFDWNVIPATSVPRCPRCGGVILPDFVLRHLATYPAAITQGRRIMSDADLLLIVGTQRSAASFSPSVPKIIVNRDGSTTPRRHDAASIFLTGDASLLLPQLITE